MRQAITSARTDNGLPANEWYNIGNKQKYYTVCEIMHMSSYIIQTETFFRYAAHNRKYNPRY